MFINTFVVISYYHGLFVKRQETFSKKLKKHSAFEFNITPTIICIVGIRHTSLKFVHKSPLEVDMKLQK